MIWLTSVSTTSGMVRSTLSPVRPVAVSAATASCATSTAAATASLPISSAPTCVISRAGVSSDPFTRRTDPA